MSPGPEPVWVTGVGLVSSLGEGAAVHRTALARARPAPVLDEAGFAPFAVHPAPALALDRLIPRKSDQRQMEPWQRLGTYAAGLALEDAGVAEADVLARTHLVVAAGGGERDEALEAAVAAELAALPPAEAGPLLNARLAGGLRPTLFLAQLSNLLAGNISIVHGVTGSSRTLMGEEAAGAEAVRVAAARLAHGAGGIALVGGAYVPGRWDLLLHYGAGGALWRGPFAPISARAPRGGFVPGAVAAFLVLETEAHARARGARGLARLAAVATAASPRAAPGQAADAARTLWDGVSPLLGRGRFGVVSGATGVAAVAGEEAAFLAGLAPRAVVRTPGSVIGHGVEASFAATLALATLAVEGGAFPAPLDPADPDDAPDAGASVLATGFGQWRGEALAVLAPLGLTGRAAP